MKKPETPKSDASAKPVDTQKSTETISVDSSGNASSDAKPASKPTAAQTDTQTETKSGTKSDAQSGAKPDAAKSPSQPGSKPTDKPGATASTTAKPEIKPASAHRNSQSSDKSSKTDGSAASRKGVGGKALLLFVIIIVGAIAAGWLTRAIWWRDAEPVLSQYVPTVILDEITPEEFKDDGAITATNAPSQPEMTDPNDQNNTIPAPDEDATMAEKDDGMVSEEDSLPPVDGDTNSVSSASPLPDGSVVVDPELTERLSRLEGTIDALRERLNSERGDTLNNTVARRMAEIETRTAPIEELARVESELAGVANEMREMSARLSTMEEEVRATAGLRVESRGQAIAMAVTILRDALQRGGPFIIALNQLERSSGDDPLIAEQITTLKPLADQGAPTIEKLRQSFPVMHRKPFRPPPMIIRAVCLMQRGPTSKN